MVDISRLASIICSIDDVVLVQAEIVTVTDSKLSVGDFSFVSYRVSDFLSDIFDDNVFGIQSIAIKVSLE